MNLFFLYPATKNRDDQSDKHALVHNEPPRNTNEGSEFLDDVIHMTDLPLIYTEESIATGSPKNLF